MFTVINLFGNHKENILKLLESKNFLSEDGTIIDVKEKHYETYVTLDFVDDKTEEFNQVKQTIESEFNKYIYGYDNQNLYTCAFSLLKEKKLKLALAESVTAGRLSSEFVGNNDGASTVLIEGIVCYSIQSKCARFNIDESFFEKNSPQSIETSKALVTSLFKQSNAEVCIAVTGYASNIASDDNGEAFIAIALDRGIYTQRVKFEGTRNHIMQQIAKYSFMFLIKLIQAFEK